MLTSVQVERFRCLKEVTVRLSPFTVLVGPNAAGKTAFLTYLNPSLAPSPRDWFQRDVSKHLVRRIVFDDDHVNAEKIFGAGIQVHGERRLYTYQSARFDLNRLREVNKAQVHRQLTEDGRNLTNVLATLTRKQQNDVAAQLCKLVPTFSDVDVRPAEGHEAGSQQIFFEDRWKPGLWYTPNEVSDGTMLMLGYLLLQYQEAPIDLLTIEEPERGLHPYLLAELITMLRGLSEGRFGPRKIQVIAATHSAELLDHLQPEEVRFFRRDSADGAVQVTEASTDTPDWRAAYDEYQKSLGSIWLSGAVGGVPGA